MTLEARLDRLPWNPLHTTVVVVATTNYRLRGGVKAARKPLEALSEPVLLEA
ncbi:MAG: hypothetical protein ACRDNW_20680 [Trebonia sp.]